MNSKKILFIAMLFIGILVFTSAASAGWYRCTVNETGVDPGNGIAYINLTMVDNYTPPSANWTGGRWFSATGDYKSLLAVGLSAIAGGSYVTVDLVDENAAAYSTIRGMFQRNYPGE